MTNTRAVRILSLCFAMLSSSAIPTTTQASQRARAATIEQPRTVHVEARKALMYDEHDFSTLRDAHATGAPFELNGFPVQDGGRVELLLEPVHVMPKGGYATVVELDGSTTRVEPTIRLFRGVVIGRGGRAFFGVDDSGITGRIELDGVDHIVSTGDWSTFDENEARVASELSSAESLSHWCQTPMRQSTLTEDSVLPAPRASGPRDQDVGINVRVCDVFLDVDTSFGYAFATRKQAINYTLLLMGATSEIYRRDLGIVLRIPRGYLRIWKRRPPWRGGLMEYTTFRSWWVTSANPASMFPRAAVVLLTKGPNVGLAPVGAACNETDSFAWTALSTRGVFPFQHTSKDNADLVIFAHELGHIFGTHHTSSYQPPIKCIDGSGPDRGTIMGYCWGNNNAMPEYERYGMRFHERVQDVIRAFVEPLACPEVISIRRGDYDYNDRLDAFDLAELDGYLAQGFASRGAEETFDMNRDGIVDIQDRKLLAIDAHVPEAFSTRRFSVRPDAKNCDCFFSLSRPLLGRTWEAQVRSENGARTFVLGSTMPLERGIATDGGDLLIGLTRHGADELFLSRAVANGTEAIHRIALPLDAALVGFRVYTQAAVITRGVVTLSNAIDLSLSLN